MKYLFILIGKIIGFTLDTLWLVFERVYKYTYKIVYFIWHFKQDVSKSLNRYDVFYSYRSLKDYYLGNRMKVQCKVCKADSCDDFFSQRNNDYYTCEKCLKSTQNNSEIEFLEGGDQTTTPTREEIRKGLQKIFEKQQEPER